ncbi:MAG: SDR family oxidoreductase [Promethearchaeota archaeon]
MDKTILITGASSGIGKATSKYFQEKGWNVIATMRSPEKEVDLIKFENVLVTRLDVLYLASIKDAIIKGINKFGKINVLLNNAGYASYGLLEAASYEKIMRQFNTNVIGYLLVIREILPHFRKNKEGLIINISTIGGRIAFPLGTLYHGSKWAVEGISEALSFELDAIGCKIKIVEPGVIATDFYDRSFDFFNEESLIEYQETVQKTKNFLSLAGNMAEPAIAAAKVIYEATTDGKDQLRYIVGDYAKETLANRKKFDDATFYKGFKTQIGF